MAYTTIKKPSDYFNTVLYSGNSSTNPITGVGHQPDLTWIKRRNSAEGHIWIDSVRGVDKRLGSNVTSAESTVSYFTSFDTDGFTLNGTNIATNVSGGTFTAWNWLGANGTASNTDGSITSTVSANTTSGFSIVSYTGNGTAGATVGHGLGATPSFYILKSRSTANTWYTYNKITGATKTLPLNTNDAETASGFTNSTEPTSSVFSLGSASAYNGSGDTFIAYCFADVQGYSKFGSYTGNGSTDGTFIYTGFKPAWIMIKRTDTANVWHMIDNKRNTFNTVDKVLFAEVNNTEATSGSNQVDFVSNGFKARNSGSQINASGGSYIYMAFAEQPLVGDNPATAR